MEAGFNLEMIGPGKPKECLRRWKRIFKSFGEEGLLRETRGKGSTGRPQSSNMTDTEKLKKAEAKIKYLEAELDFIKKLDALERQVKKADLVNKYDKFMLIHEIYVSSKKVIKIKHLCDTAKVSRSGYYACCNAAQRRVLRNKTRGVFFIYKYRYFLKKKV